MACGGRGSLLLLLLLLLLLGLEAWISEPGLGLGAECGSGSGSGVREGAEELDWRDGGMEGKHGKVKKKAGTSLGEEGGAPSPGAWGAL